MSKNLDFSKLSRKYYSAANSEILSCLMTDPNAIVRFKGKIPGIRFNAGNSTYTDMKNITIGFGRMHADNEQEFVVEMLFDIDHETGHIIHTDNKAWMMCFTEGERVFFNALAKKFDISIILRSEKDIERLLKLLSLENMVVSRHQVKHFIHFILNSLEDGRMERKVRSLIPEFANRQIAVRGKEWNETEISQEMVNAVKKGDKRTELLVVLNQVLTLATCGCFQKGFVNELGDTDLFAELNEKYMTPIAKAVAAKSTKKMLPYVYEIETLIMERLIEVATMNKQELDKVIQQVIQEILKDKLDEFEETDGEPSEAWISMPNNNEDDEDSDDEDNSSSNNSDSNDKNEDSMSSIFEKDEEKSDSSNTSDETDEENNSEESDANNSTSSNNEDENTFNSKSNSIKDESDEDDEDGNSESENASSSDSDNTADNNNEDSNSDDCENSSQSASTDKSNNEKSEDEIKSAIEEAAKKAMEEANGIKELADSTPKENPLKDAPFDDTEELIKEYGGQKFVETLRQFPLNIPLPTDLAGRCNMFAGEIKKMLPKDVTIAKKGKSVSGKQLHRLVLGKTDVFLNRRTPDTDGLVAYILVDNSGSMSWGYGKYSNRHYALEACAIVEEGFKKLMPLKIVAFDEEDAVIHDCIKQFDEVQSGNCSYNYLVQGREGGGNCDGYDIRVATKELLTRTEKRKLLIVMSDGTPSCYGNRRSGEEDVRTAVEEATAKGISVIGINFGIGTDITCNLAKSYYKMYGKENSVLCNPEDIEKNLLDKLKKFYFNK